jgi:HPr kinase/phosphorylase
LLEVRGLGILRVPHLPEATLRLVVTLGPGPDRLPGPARHHPTDLPLVAVDPAHASAARVVSLALDCALGRVAQVAGAFS